MRRLYLVGLALPPHLVVAGGAVLLATSLAGVGVGVYLGGMVGLNVGSTRLKAFEQERIHKAHPQAHPEGTEPRIPAFP